MDWSELHKFVKESGGRALIVIDGQPSLVVTSYRYHQEDEMDAKVFPVVSEKAEEVARKRELLIDDLPL